MNPVKQPAPQAQALPPSPDMQIAAVQKKRNLISLTPLIDVVFILLVFFMLVTDFAQFSIVQLSVAQDENAVDMEQTSSIVHISSSGELQFDQQEISFTHLTALARDKLDENQGHIFFIQPDDKTSLQDTVFVLDELVPLAPNNISFLRDLAAGMP